MEPRIIDRVLPVRRFINELSSAYSFGVTQLLGVSTEGENSEKDEAEDAEEEGIVGDEGAVEHSTLLWLHIDDYVLLEICLVTSRNLSV